MRSSPSTIAAAIAALALVPAAANGQDTPSHWKWVTDAPANVVAGHELADGDWRFTTMAPGWHVTMGPGGVLYDPAYDLSGRFAVEAEIFLFPQPADAGYGLFAGGRDLEGASRGYVAFLARGDGSAGVFRWSSRGAEPVVDWARHDAVLPRDPGGTAKNVIRVEAEQDSVRFRVNGQTIATLARDGLALDGHAGLRVGAGVNLHASNLDITRRLAPAPSR